MIPNNFIDATPRMELVGRYVCLCPHSAWPAFTPVQAAPTSRPAPHPPLHERNPHAQRLAHALHGQAQGGGHGAVARDDDHAPAQLAHAFAVALEEQGALLAFFVAFLGVVAGQVVGEQHEVPALVEQGFQLAFGRCVFVGAGLLRRMLAQVDQGKWVVSSSMAFLLKRAGRQYRSFLTAWA